MGSILKKILELLLKRGKKPKTTNKPEGGTNTTKCVSGCSKLPRLAKRPHKRHDPCRVNNNDRTKRENSMLDPNVDVENDIFKLNNGDFVRKGEDLIVNGRTYGWHPDKGTVFPKSGPGVVQLDRAQHKVLRDLNTRSFDTVMDSARRIKGLTQDKIDTVLNLWGKCK